MQLHCPQCNQPVQAEKINIQRMVAVCGSCSSVFEFQSQPQKAKRRKAKRPQQLHILAEEPLHLAFRANFRLDKSESFQSSAIMSGVFSLLTLLMAGLVLEGEAPVFLPFIFLLLAATALYSLATIVYNQTHIRLDSDTLFVARRPLPSLTQARQFSLAGIESFHAQETAASQREGYDTPRFHVWANFIDGGRRLACGDLTEEYADYIANALNQRQLQSDFDSSSRLSEGRHDTLEAERHHELEEDAEEGGR